MTTDIILPPFSKAIPLSRGMFAIVDTADYEWLMQWKWHYRPTGYAFRAGKIVKGKRGKYIRMHRLIMNPPDDMEIDHINMDGLDNRRGNLRICTKAENARNGIGRKKRKSKYKGVYFNKHPHHFRKPWYSHIVCNHKIYYNGNFLTEIEAAHAYNEAAKRLHGEFARLNVIP